MSLPARNMRRCERVTQTHDRSSTKFVILYHARMPHYIVFNPRTERMRNKYRYLVINVVVSVHV